MIKAVILDYGGVVTKGGAGNDVATRLSKFLNIPVDQATALVRIPWSDFSKGHITEEEYWKVVETSYGQSIPLEYRAVWNTWEQMIQTPEMVEYIHNLKSRGYVVGLLSNVNPLTESMLRTHNAYELFNPCILSCKIGYAKPDKEMYEELLRQLPEVKPNEIVFVDDQERCLVPARELGIRTILAVNADQIISEIDRMLAVQP